MKRIPSLDGLRAISILFVVFGHLGGTRNAPEIITFLERYANFGVRVFFIISGYLITTLLLREHAKTSTISLREFYIRRVYRIFSAAYAFAIVALVVFASQMRFRDVLTALTYTVNYNSSPPWPIGHLWSLAVEEQFYILWPASS